MAGKITIKHVLLEKKMNVTQLAEKLGTTQGDLSNKLYRNTFSLREYLEIMDVLDCDVVAVMRNTKKQFSEPVD